MALDAGQVIKAVYDASDARLKTENAGAPTTPQPDVKLSAKQIWKRVYNSTTGKLRTVTV